MRVKKREKERRRRGEEERERKSRKALERMRRKIVCEGGTTDEQILRDLQASIFELRPFCRLLFCCEKGRRRRGMKKENDVSKVIMKKIERERGYRSIKKINM